MYEFLGGTSGMCLLFLSFFLFFFLSFFLAQQPNAGQGRLVPELSISHTTLGGTPLIGPSPRPLPDNTQLSQQTNIHAFGGIRTHSPSKRAIADRSAIGIGACNLILTFYVGKFITTLETKINVTCICRCSSYVRWRHSVSVITKETEFT
jgi:hypothetical protein